MFMRHTPSTSITNVSEASQFGRHLCFAKMQVKDVSQTGKLQDKRKSNGLGTPSWRIKIKLDKIP